MSNIINKEAYKAFEFIRYGGVILYPTDTIWGLGCDATNCEAVERIYNIQRWTEMPKGGHFAALEQPDLLVKDIRDFAKSL